MSREPLRLSDLLGAPVLDRAGREIGHVQDVRLARGPASAQPWGPVAIAGIVVDGRHAGSLLGYDRRHQQGPAVIRGIVRWLHRHARYVPWEQVRIDEGQDGAARAQLH